MDAKELKARALKARESDIVIDDVTFVVRRPSQMDSFKWAQKFRDGDQQGAMSDAYFHVIGWRGVPASFFDPAAGDEDAPFDQDLLMMYLNDHVMTGQDLSNQIWNLVQADQEEKKTSKNISNSSITSES